MSQEIGISVGILSARAVEVAMANSMQSGRIGGMRLKLVRAWL